LAYSNSDSWINVLLISHLKQGNVLKVVIMSVKSRFLRRMYQKSIFTKIFSDQLFSSNTSRNFVGTQSPPSASTLV